MYVAKNILKELEGVFSLENLKCTAIQQNNILKELEGVFGLENTQYKV